MEFTVRASLPILKIVMLTKVIAKPSLRTNCTRTVDWTDVTRPLSFCCFFGVAAAVRLEPVAFAWDVAQFLSPAHTVVRTRCLHSGHASIKAEPERAALIFNPHKKSQFLPAKPSKIRPGLGFAEQPLTSLFLLPHAP